MNDWTSGYVADIDYTYSYFGELNPLRSRLALLKKGIPCPVINTACELGFGQGLSTNIHAAATTCKWYGTDFNPAQAGFAQELASFSGNNAELYDQAFGEFCQRSDLPDFDFIGIHGIWSWISSENREFLVDFIRRKLKVGGLVYISYNTSPGQAAFAPIRKLMTDHAEIIGAKGSGILNRIEGAVKFVDALLETNPHYLSANPKISEKLKKLKTQDRHYIAHEYFNRDWNSMNFSDMAATLASAKLDYACSASYLDHLDVYNFTEDQQKFLSEIPDLTLQQSVRDVMSNNAFRQDYWIKGVRTVPNVDLLELIRTEAVMLCVNQADISLKFNCLRGEANLNEAIYKILLDVLEDYEIHTIGKIVDYTEVKGISLPQVLECLFTLIHRGEVLPVKGATIPGSVIESCHKLNAYLMNLSRSNADQSHLVSPVTGGGIVVSRIHQLLILAHMNGDKSAEGMASSVWKIIGIQGQKLIKEGKTLQTDKENIQYLREMAGEFLEKRLKILEYLMIIPKD